MSARVWGSILVAGMLLVGIGQTSATSAGPALTITFWSHTHPPMVDLNKQLIAEFEAANPGVHVDYTVIPNNQFFTKVLTAMTTGTGPDVMNMSSSQTLTYIEGGRVMPVDPLALGFKSQADLEAAWQPGAFAGAVRGGKIFGIPSEYNVAVLVVNGTYLKQVGFNPANDIATWDDLIQLAQRVTVRQGDRLLRRGFDFPYLQNFYSNTFQILLYQYGGSILNVAKTESTINSDAGVKALTFWRDIVKRYKVGGPEYSPRDATNPMQDYAAGDVAMYIAYPWTLPAVQENMPVYQATRVKLLPQANPAKPVTIAYAYYWMVNSQSQQPQVAWKFINFLASHPTRWLKEVGFIQPRKGWETTPEARTFPFLSVWLEAMGTSRFILQHVRANEIGQAIQRAIERTIFNNVDPKASLDQAKREIDEALSQR